METDSTKYVQAPHQVVENYRAQLTATKTLYNDNIPITHDVPGGWTSLFIVPEKRAYVITNIWMHSSIVAEGTSVNVRFRHKYPGGSWVTFWGYNLRTDDEDGGAKHHEVGAKVLEAGSELQIAAIPLANPYTGVLGLTLDGAEITQT